MTDGHVPRRDRAAAALCLWILRHVATDRFRRSIEGVIRHSLFSAARRRPRPDRSARADQLWAEAASRATDADREKVARMIAHVKAQAASIDWEGRR